MRYGSMKVTQMPPVHEANLVANSGNTAHRVDVIENITHNIPRDFYGNHRRHHMTGPLTLYQYAYL